MSRKTSSYSTWLLALTAGMTLASGAWAIDPTPPAGQAVAVESIIASWESADARLAELLGQVPEKARKGIERAIQANREGRQRALAALESAGADREAGRERAQLALEQAAAKAEAGIDKARSHVPDDVLPRLDEASSKMHAGINAGAAGIAKQTERGMKPQPLPSADRPSVSPSGDFGRPSGVGRPANPGRPSRPPSR